MFDRVGVMGFFISIYKNLSSALKFDKKPLYTKILYYILISVAATILIISMVQYFYARENTIRQISSFYTDSLKQVSYSAEFMISSANSLIAQMYLDPDISPLINSSNLNEQEVTTGVRRLGLLGNSFNLIQSIYIYNGSTETFYSTIDSQAMKEEDDFFDKEFLSILKSAGDSSYTKLVARKILPPGVTKAEKNYVRVFSFIYFDMSRDGHVDSAIVVNVSELWLRGIMNAISTLKGGSIFVLDENNTVISGNSNDLEAEISGNNSFTKRIDNNNSDSGYFTANIGETEYIATYVFSKELKWKFVRISPFSGLMKQTRGALMKAVILSIAFLILGFLVSFLLSRLVYRPVHSELSNLQMELSETKGDNNEHKNSFLRKLILSSLHMEDSKLVQEFDKYGIKLKKDNPVVLILFRIDHYAALCSKYNNSDRDLMKFAILNIATELISESYTCEAVDIANDHVVVIAGVDSGFDFDTPEALKDHIVRVQEAVEKYLCISLSVSVSPKGFFGKEIEGIYIHALDTSNYRILYGFQSVIFCSNIDVLSSDGYQFPDEKSKLLTDSLMLGKIDEAKDLFDEIIKTTYGFSYSTIKSVLSKLQIKIIYDFENIEKVSGVYTSIALNNFVDCVNNAETLEEIYESFNCLVDTLEQKLDEKKKNKHDELIERIIKTINTNYANDSLCMDSIAENIGMSSVYLGRVFKKNTSKSISDYINETRLAKAKELLENSEKSALEIAQNIGFANSKYFFTIFKKANGITPTEYRLKVRKEKSRL